LSSETELFASSSSTSDTTNFIIVSGLDGDYNRKYTVTQLTGQTQVSVGTFLRVQTCSITTASAIGDVYIAESDTLTAGVPNTPSKVQSKIIAGKNVTHNGWITVPAGYSAINMAVRGTTDASAKAATIKSLVWNEGSDFSAEFVEYAVTTSFGQFTFPTPVGTVNITGSLSPVIPEKTDIEAKALVDTNNTNIFFGADYLIAPSADLILW
jgi:hypothetical protein